jgi:ArsR family transcriptional regulator, arsenate/arsenite/antimonite-responsive transcriptional repressor
MSSAVAKAALPLRQESIARVAGWFHALSDETRLQIIDCLSEREQCVCDLTDLLAAGQSRLSFHLKILKDAGILKDRREGRWVYYSLNPEVIEELEHFVSSLKACCRRAKGVSRCCS